jgi:hypothetical protein
MEQTTINTEKGNRISVDIYERWDLPGSPNDIWLSIAVPMASVSAVMTKAQAKELAAVLMAFAEQEVAA